MSLMVFINLPVTDVARSREFYTSLGATVNEKFSDENSACIVFSDEIYFMILTPQFLGTFTDKAIVDPRVQLQTSVNFTRDSREEVDRAAEAALAAGGTEPRPAQDLGFMYSRDVEDPDGNALGFLYMVDEAVEKGPEAYMAEHS